jgi:hypothetical protein
MYLRVLTLDGHVKKTGIGTLIDNAIAIGPRQSTKRKRLHYAFNPRAMIRPSQFHDRASIIPAAHNAYDSLGVLREPVSNSPSD